MNFGIMGPGRIAHSFCGAVREIEGSKVLAVASKSSKERAEAFAKEENIDIFYGNYEELLNNKDIETIYISTTHNFHYDNIKLCLNAGKHVLCEKPMVLTEKEARELFAMAKEKNLFLMEAMWSRFQPKTKKVKEWVRDGRIGEARLAQGTIGFCAPVDYSDRFYNPDLAGGTLYDMGIYLIDLLPYFINKEIKEVSEVSMYAPTGVDTQLNITMELDGAIVSGQATVMAVVPEDAYIYGSEGYIKIPKIHWGHEAILYDKDQKEVEHFSEPEDWGFVYEVREVIDCISKGKLTSDIASPEMTYISCGIFDKIKNR